MKKTCTICGSKYEGSFNSKYCGANCESVAYRRRQNPLLAKYKDYKQCPLLEKCHEISNGRLNCRGRDFLECNLFLNLLSDKEKEKQKLRVTA